MAWSSYQLFLALSMTVTGTLNTLALKWMDTLSAEGLDGVEKKFDHPFVQSFFVFVGEACSLIVFKLWLFYKRRRKAEVCRDAPRFSPCIFIIPALCDMTGSSLMYIGLTLTLASSFQMLRGSVIVFVALLSGAFLRRSLTAVNWVGICLVLCGLGIVGTADILHTSLTDINGIISGDMLIVIAQIVCAVQVVVEDKYFGKYQVKPAQTLGWEGVMGMIILGTLMIPLHFIPAGQLRKTDARAGMENIVEAFVQMKNNPLLLLAMLGNSLTIASFNFCGISVTESLGGAHRMILDSLRTVPIWIVSVLVGWQPFMYLQLIGFFLLIGGICVFNNIIVGDVQRYLHERKQTNRKMSNIARSYQETSKLLDDFPKNNSLI